MDIASAEMTKYAANAMLATRISFMNDIANLCDLVGADVEMVRKGIGSDVASATSSSPRVRIRRLVLARRTYRPWPTRAANTVTRCRSSRLSSRVNEAQKEVPVRETRRAAGRPARAAASPSGDWPSSPRPTTCARPRRWWSSGRLLEAGAEVAVYDPAAMEECRRMLPGQGVTCARTMYEAAEGADAVVLLTEWKEFRMPDWPACARRCAETRSSTGATSSTTGGAGGRGSATGGIGK